VRRAFDPFPNLSLNPPLVVIDRALRPVFFFTFNVDSGIRPISTRRPGLGKSRRYHYYSMRLGDAAHYTDYG